MMSVRLIDQVASLRGHFCVEEGSHAPMCIDLAPLVRSPEWIEPRVRQLALCLSTYEPEAICGGHVAGGTLARLVAQELDVPFRPAFSQPRDKRRDALEDLAQRIRARLSGDHFEAEEDGERGQDRDPRAHQRGMIQRSSKT